MAVFDWASLIPKGIDLGLKATGDALFPNASLQNARTNATNSQNDIAIARARMANANQIRAAALPGMYTQLGYSPQQGQSMASGYSANASTPGYTNPPSGGGSSVGRTALGIGASFAPAALGAAFKSAAPSMVRQAIQIPGAAATAGTAAGGSGFLGTLGGLATNPITLGAAGVLGAGLLAKKAYGNGADRQAADVLTGTKTGSGQHVNNGSIHDQFKSALEMPEGNQKQAALQQVAQNLLEFSKLGKAQYYQAQKTFRDFNQWSNGAVPVLLG